LKQQLIELAPAAAGWLGMLWVSPVTALAGLVLGGGLLLITRSQALSICLAALSFPLGVWLVDHPGAFRLALAVALAAGLTWYYRQGLRIEP
jgi:glucose uptake protein GlcU